MRIISRNEIEKQSRLDCGRKKLRDKKVRTVRLRNKFVRIMKRFGLGFLSN